MGRPRKRNRHLPRGMSLEHGAYYFRGRNRQRVNLGQDFPDALVKYAKLIGPAPRLLTLHDVIAEYRIKVLPLKRSKQTRTDEARALTLLDETFGHMLPDNITAVQCYHHLDNRQTKDGKLAPVAARHEIALLGHVLAKAIRWGAGTANVVRTLDRQDKNRRSRYVTGEEFAAVRALANPRVQLAMDLARLTGQRRGDILTLRREQCGETGIMFRQSKTGAGVLVEWSPALQECIERSGKMPPQIPRDFIIRRPSDGLPYTPLGFSAMWQRLMSKYADQGGQRFTFHDLRAKAASDKDTLEGAADLLGHASSATTKRHYRRTLTKAKPVE